MFDDMLDRSIPMYREPAADDRRRNGDRSEARSAGQRQRIDPYRVDENVELLKRYGCPEVEAFYR